MLWFDTILIEEVLVIGNLAITSIHQGAKPLILDFMEFLGGNSIEFVKKVRHANLLSSEAVS
jgi:hypothetical protein